MYHKKSVEFGGETRNILTLPFVLNDVKLKSVVTVACLCAAFAFVFLTYEDGAKNRNLSKSRAESDPLECARYLASMLATADAENSIFSDLSLRASRLGLAKKSAYLVGPNLPRATDKREDYRDKVRLIGCDKSGTSVDSAVVTIERLSVGRSRDWRLLEVVRGAVDAGLNNKAETIVPLMHSSDIRAKAYLALTVARDSSITVKSESYVDSAYSISKLAQADSQLVMLLPEIAGKYLDIGCTSKALDVLQRSESTANNLNEPSTLDILSEVAEIYLRARRFDDVLRVAGQMTKSSNGDMHLQMLSLKCSTSGECDLARQIGDRITNEIVRASVLVNAGNCYASHSLSYRAVEILQAASSLAVDTGDTGQRIRLVNRVARSFCRMGRSDLARDVLKNAEELAATADDWRDDDYTGSREGHRGMVAQGYLLCGFLADAERILRTIEDACLVNEFIGEIYTTLECEGKDSEAQAVRQLEREKPAPPQHSSQLFDWYFEDSLNSARADVLLASAQTGKSDTESAIDSMYSSRFKPELLIRYAEFYSVRGDTAHTRVAITDALMQCHFVLGGGSGDTLASKVVTICDKLNDTLCPFDMLSSADSTKSIPDILAFASVYCQRGEWNKCVAFASQIAKRQDRIALLTSLAGWYYILQPYSGDQQTELLRKLVAMSQQ